MCGLYINHIAILFPIYLIMCGKWDAGQVEAGKRIAVLVLINC